MAEHRDAALVLRRKRGGWTGTGDASCRLGDPPAAGPEAVFASWSWDGRRLDVANDRYGLVPMYWSGSADRFTIATTPRAALAAGVSAELDLDALALLERFGQFVGDDTAFRELKRLPPGARLTLAGTEPRLDGGPFIVPERPLARDEALDAYVDEFRAAIGRRVPDEPYVHPLSGGRDSRHSLFALVEAGAPPSELLTVRHVPPKPDEDLRIARRVAERLGLPHRIIARSDRPVEDEARKNRLSHFEAPFTHGWSMPLVDHLSDYRGVLFDGFGGDVLSMARYLDPENLRLHRSGRLEELAERLLRAEDRVPTLIPRGGGRDEPGGPARSDRDRAVARLARELALHADAPNPIRSFRFWNYSRRLIALSPLGLLHDHRVRLPYVDHRLFDLLAGLRAEVILPGGGHFHTEAIRRAFPAWADIPFENPDARPRPDPAYYRMVARRSLAHLARGATAGDLQHTTALAVRLIRCLVDPGYAEAAKWLGPLVVYADQVRRMSDISLDTRTGTT
ncbi:MAG: asparagine synthase-related protein [Gemmatimonadota bacterium]